MFILCSSSLFAQAAPTTAPALSGKLGKPIELFNGKDYTGWMWVTEPMTKMEDSWTIKDGAMHCTGKPNGYIRTEKEYGPDYRLIVEYRHITKGGGGTLFGISGPDKVWPKTMQVQGSFGNVGDLVNQGAFNWFVEMSRYRKSATDERVLKMAKASEKPLGEWNTVELYVDHDNVWVLVNGTLQNVVSGMDELTGKIGFQNEDSEMEFRKVQVTPIEKN
jgi:Domain of Unknown Function (DUF1080)